MVTHRRVATTPRFLSRMSGQGWRMNDEQLPQGMSHSDWSEAGWLLRDTYLFMLIASY